MTKDFDQWLGLTYWISSIIIFALGIGRRNGDLILASIILYLSGIMFVSYTNMILLKRGVKKWK